MSDSLSFLYDKPFYQYVLQLSVLFCSRPVSPVSCLLHRQEQCASPFSCDLGEKTMLNRVELVAVWRIVNDEQPYSQPVREIHKVLLDNLMRAGVGVALVAQYNEHTGIGILVFEVAFPHPLYICADEPVDVMTGSHFYTNFAVANPLVLHLCGYSSQEMLSVPCVHACNKCKIVSRSIPAVSQLGCSPCTLAIGIGRSQFEATSLLIEAMAKGNYGIQSEMEQTITNRVNESHVGALGLGGKTSVIATFMKIGPQRASGVRIVAIRPCCCFEPRKAMVEL